MHVPEGVAQVAQAVFGNHVAAFLHGTLAVSLACEGAVYEMQVLFAVECALLVKALALYDFHFVLSLLELALFCAQYVELPPGFLQGQGGLFLAQNSQETSKEG